MRAYKYVDPIWAAKFENGESFKIGSFQHYRNIEGQRSDGLEGKVRHIIDHANFAIMDKESERRLEKFGIVLKNCSNITFQNVTIENRIDLSFMFCASLERNKKLGCGLIRATRSR